MMAKRTFWNWLFGLMAQPTEEPRPMAVPNNPARSKPLAGTVSLTEDDWNELCGMEGGLPITVSQAATSRHCSDRSGAQAEGVNITPRLHGQRQRERDEYFARLAGQPAATPWEPGIEHTQPHPVKENKDGTLYYKGKVYRQIGAQGGRKDRKAKQFHQLRREG